MYQAPPVSVRRAGPPPFSAYHANLLETVRKYIALRMQLTSRLVTGVGLQQNFSSASDVEAMQVDQLSPSACLPPRDQQDNGDEASSDARKTSPTPSVARSLESSSIKLPASKETTQTLLQHIAQVSEEALHASEEKVNIAQTAYETVLHPFFRLTGSHSFAQVDRHIRLLDQAIKEQETSISLGIRPGTHLAPILLPDLVVPRWARPTRIEHSPTPSLSPEPTTVPLPTEELPGGSVRPGRGRKARKKPELQPETPPPPLEEVLNIPTTRTTRSVKLKIPAQADVKGSQVAGDSNEPRYCYCNQVSFGTVRSVSLDLPWMKLKRSCGTDDRLRQ